MSLKIYTTFFAGHFLDAFSLHSFVKPFKFSVFASHVVYRNSLGFAKRRWPRRTSKSESSLFCTKKDFPFCFFLL